MIIYGEASGLAMTKYPTNRKDARVTTIAAILTTCILDCSLLYNFIDVDEETVVGRKRHWQWQPDTLLAVSARLGSCRDPDIPYFRGGRAAITKLLELSFTFVHDVIYLKGLKLTSLNDLAHSAFTFLQSCCDRFRDGSSYRVNRFALLSRVGAQSVSIPALVDSLASMYGHCYVVMLSNPQVVQAFLEAGFLDSRCLGSSRRGMH